MKFYKCIECGEVFVSNDFDECVSCCGELKELIPNSEDAALEKHVPVCDIIGDKVKVRVGEVEHPMTNEHYIEFIFIVGSNNSNQVYFEPGDKPEVIFDYEKGVKIYAYCNIHGLWVCELA